MQFDWSVLGNQLFEFNDTADVRAHSLFIMIILSYTLQISMMNYSNVAHFKLVIWICTVALTMPHDWLPLNVSPFLAIQFLT